MALAHSRVRRVFFSIPNPAFGGLDSAFNLARTPVTHRIDGFRGGLTQTEEDELLSCHRIFCQRGKESSTESVTTNR